MSFIRSIKNWLPGTHSNKGTSFRSKGGIYLPTEESGITVPTIENNYAALFDGVNDIMASDAVASSNPTYAPGSSDTLIYHCWIKPTTNSLTTHKTLMFYGAYSSSVGRRAHMYYLSNNRFGFQVGRGDTGLQSIVSPVGVDILPGETAMLTGKYCRSQQVMELWLNNTLVSSTPSGTPTWPSIANWGGNGYRLYVGAAGNSGTYFSRPFHGQISNVIVTGWDYGNDRWNQADMDAIYANRNIDYYSYGLLDVGLPSDRGTWHVFDPAIDLISGTPDDWLSRIEQYPSYGRFPDSWLSPYNGASVVLR